MPSLFSVEGHVPPDAQFVSRAPPAAEKLTEASVEELFNMLFTDGTVEDETIVVDVVVSSFEFSVAVPEKLRVELGALTAPVTSEAVCVAGIHWTALWVDDATATVDGLIPVRPESVAPPLVLFSALFNS